VLIKVLAAPVLSYSRAVLTGKLPYPLPVPFTPGVSPIGRVEAVGSDSTSIRPGQLVYVDATVRARDDVTGFKGTSILQGLFGGATPSAQRLSHSDWRNGSWAEKEIVPLENVYVLDEALLLQKGYGPTRLTWINTLLVPYGGWLAADLQPGETAILCFATGHFGRSAIDVALALGVGTVLAVGRNLETLAALQAQYPAGRVAPVAIPATAEGADEKETSAALTAALLAATPNGAGADVFLDLTPGTAPPSAKWPHIGSAISALRVGGRAILMGGTHAPISIPYSELMMRNITLRGNFMFDATAPAKLIRLIERGNLPLNRFQDVEFPLEQYEAAIDKAGTVPGAESAVVLTNKE
jgi:threonine dehydrogenase-like Zn-dependent dehydrogenase